MLKIFQVELSRTGDELKESHVILEQCLQDNDWIQSVSHLVHSNQIFDF